VEGLDMAAGDVYAYICQRAHVFFLRAQDLEKLFGTNVQSAHSWPE